MNTDGKLVLDLLLDGLITLLIDGEQVRGNAVRSYFYDPDNGASGERTASSPNGHSLKTMLKKWVTLLLMPAMWQRTCDRRHYFGADGYQSQDVKP